MLLMLVLLEPLTYSTAYLLLTIVNLQCSPRETSVRYGIRYP